MHQHDTESLIPNLVNIGVRLIPISLHLLGIYLLSIVPKQNINATQRLLLLNLSIVTVSFLFCTWLASLVHVLIPSNHFEFLEYISLVQLTGFSFVYYLAMICITADRFLEMYLNIKYALYWSGRHTLKLMYFIWFIGATFSSVMVILYYKWRINYTRYCYIYFFPIIEAIFLAIALVTYSYIFERYYKQLKILKNRKKDFKNMLRRSPLLLISLIIATFVLFMIVPDMILFSYHYSNTPLPNTVLLVTYILYTLTYTSDAVIYILLQKSVRKVAKRKFHIRKRAVAVERPRQGTITSAQSN